VDCWLVIFGKKWKENKIFDSDMLKAS